MLFSSIRFPSFKYLVLNNNNLGTQMKTEELEKLQCRTLRFERNVIQN